MPEGGTILWVPIVIGGHNLPFPVGIRLTDLSGGGAAVARWPLPVPASLEDVWEMKSGEAIFKPLKTLHIGPKVFLMLQIKTSQKISNVVLTYAVLASA